MENIKTKDEEIQLLKDRIKELEKKESRHKEIEETILESEKKFRAFFENAPVYCYRISNDGKIIDINKNALEVLGYEKEEILNKPLLKTIYSPSSIDKAKELFNQWKKTGILENEELNIITKDRKERTVLLSVNSVEDKDGEVLYSVSVQRDITERKQAEKDLKNSENKMHSIFRVAPTGIGVVKDRVMLEVNPQFCEMVGFSKEELIGKNARMLYPTQEEFEKVGKEKYRQIADSGTGIVETRLQKKDGSIINVLLASTPIDTDDHTKGVMFTVQDITKDRKAKEILQESEEKFRMITETSMDAIYQLDIKGNILYMNNAGARMYGFEPNEMVGLNFFSLLSPERFNEGSEYVKKVLEGKSIEGELYVKHKNNYEFPIEFTMVPTIKEKEIIGFSGVSRDISVRKMAEEELKRSENFLNSLIEQNPYPMWISDDKGNLIRINKACCDILNITEDEVKGKYNILKDNVVIEQGFLPLVKSVYEDGKTVRFQIHYDIKQFKHLKLKNTANVILDVTIAPVKDVEDRVCNAIIIHNNITERKMAEDELKRTKDELEVKVIERTKQLHDKVKALDKSQEAMLFMVEDLNKTAKDLRNAQEEILIKERLAVLGQFSGSISHELRNPLGVIDSSLYFLKMKLKDRDEKVEQHLDRIGSSVNNATLIIQSLLNLTRMKKPDACMNKLTDIISSSITSSKLPVTIEVIQKFPKEEIFVKVESEQCRMAFKNIIKNAVDAIKGEGTLTVTIREDKKKMIEISFKDTGRGISPENIEKVFQPLFSTKAKGIGFGLSITKMIIENHRGSIRAESNEGKGAEFIVSLPKYEK